MVHVLVHYSEIGIKKGNRKYFENLLTNNIRQRLGGLAKKVCKDYGFILVETSKTKEVVKILEKVPGIAYLLVCSKSNLSMDDMRKKSSKLLEKKGFETFRVSARRQNKNFEKTSMQVNAELGAFIVKKTGKKVQLKKPDVELVVEVCNKNAYLSIERHEGIGGLPTDPKNKVVSLMSGGFDSPVASYLMMKRGAQIILVHFQNYKQMKGSVEDKIHQLAKRLSKYQGRTLLYIIPFEKIQQDIIMNVPASVRMLVYRRLMLRISGIIADKEKAKALVTGDNMSQVSSQTLENLGAVYPASKKIVLTPLMGFNKTEIINLSKKIGTYETSKLPYGDCCSYFLPQHPELRAKLEDLEKLEEKLDKKLIAEAVKEAKKHVL
ncbi:MAG: tRNA 4-thiouridine(8) synthase ThiI [Nanoarchaeota archaeon]|nr:tRNA 4-thiouridine(8) synthase ThiI [Nanoarchaeota archaeon]